MAALTALFSSVFEVRKCVFAFLICLLGNSATIAQEPAKQLITRTINDQPTKDVVLYHQSKDWFVKCDYVELKNFRRCEISTLQVRNEKQAHRTFHLKIVLDGEKNKPLAIIQTPLDLLLSKGVDFKIDKTTIGKLTYRSCHKTGCIVPFSMTGTVSQRIRKGLKSQFTFYNLGGDELTAEFSLLGISNALRVAQNFF